MRYVNEIIDSDGRPIDGFEYELTTGHFQKLRCLDLDTGADLNGGILGDCIGKGIDAENSRGVVCRHTKKTAMFHRYVNMAESRVGFQPTEYRVSDVYFFKNILPTVSCGSTILDIRFHGQSCLVFGESGSVAMWATKGGIRKVICPLYDVFIYLCRETGINLMTYETIQFGSKASLWQTVIRLIHNDESERFFTKMLLDSAGSYVGKTGLLREVAFG